MNKQRFLKDLEKRLVILSEEERKDTINEYSDIIEEKVKHGKTEEEAVKEFGSIEELSKEILSAYKINPEYQNKKTETGEKAKDFVEATEDIIKKGAKKITEVTEEVVENFKKSDVEFTTENVFEIVIKIILALLALALLKLPFHLISEIGEGIFSIGFPPFSWIGGFVWTVLIEVIYLVVCVIIIYTLVSKYLKKAPVKSEIIKKNHSAPQPEKVEKKESKKSETVIKEEIEKPKKKVSNKDSFGDVLLLLIKIWVVIIVIVPLVMINIGLIISIIVSLYFLIKGIAIYGILILLIGLSVIIGGIYTIVYRALFSKRRIHPYSLISGIIIVVVGSILTFDFFGSLTYYDILPEDKYKQTTYEEIISVNKQTYIAGNKNIIIDNNIEDNKIKVEIIYYDDNDQIKKGEHPHYYDDKTYINYYKKSNNSELNFNKFINDRFIKDIKNKKVYNYDKIDELQIKVYVNDKTKNLIS